MISLNDVSSRVMVGLAAIAAIGIALFQLNSASSGLRVTTTTVGETPVTIMRPPSDTAAPVVVIAHGFAGSQQLMQPFAQTLAKNGYIAVTFDFLGHGRNAVPIRGDITTGTAVTDQLLAELAQVTNTARKLAGSDGRIAMLGHSMASDIVVRYARDHPDIAATVAVSVFSPVVTAALPRNLLVIDGALEPAMLIDEGLRIVNLAAGGNAAPGQTYGDFAAGSARRLALARGVEHIGVLYSRDSMTEALDWLNAVFDRKSSGAIDHRGPWLALLLAGIVALAWPLSAFLSKIELEPAGASLRWRHAWLPLLLPAMLTPLLLWKLPTDFLPILLGDYLALHFALYGALTAGVLVAAKSGGLITESIPRLRPSWKLLGAAALAVALYNILAFGLPIDTYVFSFVPITARIPLIVALACGTVPYFLADEWLTRGREAGRGVYVVSKVLFLISLALAIALNLKKLFFLIIITPAILLLFVVFGLISHFAYRATNHPAPGAIANAALFAWAMAVTFPMVVR